MATVLEHGALPEHKVERARIRVEDDPRFWRLATTDCREAVRLRHAFRDYLEAYGSPASDFDAAEAVYGELVANCIHHAPGSLRVEFHWADATLVIVDEADRLRQWPFSSDDPAAEATHLGYAIVNAFTGRVHVMRQGRGTRVTVVLPVSRAAD